MRPILSHCTNNENLVSSMKDKDTPRDLRRVLLVGRCAAPSPGPGLDSQRRRAAWAAPGAPGTPRWLRQAGAGWRTAERGRGAEAGGGGVAGGPSDGGGSGGPADGRWRRPRRRRWSSGRRGVSARRVQQGRPGRARPPGGAVRSRLPQRAQSLLAPSKQKRNPTRSVARRGLV